MNYKKLGKILGKIMILESVLMMAPLLVSFIYKEDLKHIIAFIVPIVALILIGFLLQIPKPRRETFYQKEGFALTAMVWIMMTVFGAMPFVISGDVPNYIDACFEIMSGFSTTGASIINDITAISHSVSFWRSFSHWIGGMGILVFVLIFIPESNEGSSMHLLRAESPGPQVGKIVSKMKVTTRILYLIYLGMTVLEDIAFSMENDCIPQKELIERTRAEAERVGLLSKLGDAPHALSGGQKQRVSMAGVMVNQVPILLFDEPLANLDPAAGRDAIELI